MLQSDWLSYCILLSIIRQWLKVVFKMVTSSRFSEVLLEDSVSEKTRQARPIQINEIYLTVSMRNKKHFPSLKTFNGFFFSEWFEIQNKFTCAIEKQSNTELNDCLQMFYVSIRPKRWQSF